MQLCLTLHFQTLVQFNNHNPTPRSFKLSCKLQPRPVHRLTYKAAAIAAKNIRIHTLIIGVPPYPPVRSGSAMDPGRMFSLFDYDCSNYLNSSKNSATGEWKSAEQFLSPTQVLVKGLATGGASSRNLATLLHRQPRFVAETRYYARGDSIYIMAQVMLNF